LAKSISGYQPVIIIMKRGVTSLTYTLNQGELSRRKELAGGKHVEEADPTSMSGRLQKRHGIGSLERKETSPKGEKKEYYAVPLGKKVVYLSSRLRRISSPERGRG